ncbi:hypothetical protein [Lonepinella koalarum]
MSAFKKFFSSIPPTGLIFILFLIIGALNYFFPVLKAGLLTLDSLILSSIFKYSKELNSHDYYETQYKESNNKGKHLKACGYRILSNIYNLPCIKGIYTLIACILSLILILLPSEGISNFQQEYDYISMIVHMFCQNIEFVICFLLGLVYVYFVDDNIQEWIKTYDLKIINNSATKSKEGTQISSEDPAVEGQVSERKTPENE